MLKKIPDGDDLYLALENQPPELVQAVQDNMIDPILDVIAEIESGVSVSDAVDHFLIKITGVAEQDMSAAT